MHTWYQGDLVRLNQILTNLIGNALKFTERGEILIQIQPIKVAGETATIKFEVKDTGIGIPEEFQQHIFESFAQADGSSTRRYEGSGLGLAIARQLTELMGGEISLQSVLGKGSTFSLELCLQTIPKRDTALSKGCKQILQGIRILVVDDNATNREILKHQLSAWGVNHESANDAIEAIDIMRIAARKEQPYQIAILDKLMPEMDGIELAKAIKADPVMADSKLIMLSSVTSDDEIEESERVGIETYLTKPVRQSHLYNCLVDTIEGDKSRTILMSVPNTPSPKPILQLHANILVAEDNPVNLEFPET